MRLLTSFCLCLAMLLAAVPAHTHDGARIAVIAEQVIPALIMVEAEPPEDDLPSSKQAGAGDAFPAIQDILDDVRRKRTQKGTGFFIGTDGTLVSAAHMFLEPASILVTLHDGRRLPAELVGLDQRSDIAVLRVGGLDVSPGVLRLAESEPRLGESVAAFGNPFGIGISLTTGVVSAEYRTLHGDNGTGGNDMLQYDAVIGPGHAGGPLMNMQGEVIAMHTQIFSRAGNWDGISFGVRASVLRQVSGQLIATGKVERGYLGILMQDVTPEIADAFGMAHPTGALVARAKDDGPAKAAGLREGDIVLQINGETVTSTADLARRISARGPGSLIALKINRQGEEQILTVTLTAIPALE